MKPYILCFLLTFMLLIPPFDTAVSVTTISSLSGDKMKCGATAVIMCSIQPYSNIMTWQVNTDITAQCAFGCSDNPPFSGNYVFTFDETNGIFNVTLGPVLLSDDGKVFKCDNGLSSVDFVTPAVKVIPSNADATYTTTNTTSGVDVVLTTGCVYADNVVIKWYYSKVLNNPSPDVYMINTPGTVTVSDIACQSGNCGSNNVAKRRSTLSILTSTTGETYFFFIRVSSSDFDGDLLPVGSYMLKECSCKCKCKPCKTCKITNGIAIGLKMLFGSVSIALIKHGIIQRFGAPVLYGLNYFDIGITFGDAGSFAFGAIVAGYGLGGQYDSNCTDCPCDCKGYCKCEDCKICFWLAIITYILAFCLIIVIPVFIKNRKGWCGERFSCLNRVLPVCKDTEQRGPPDGKPDSHAAKEKRREVTHNEQHNLKETGVHKDKPNKEKHEEPSKGRPLPQPTGSNRDDTGSAGAVSRQDVVLDRRPMPDIPSDRHKRGLSANFHDDRDTPLDDNILHTLPVVKKPKNALDPMNPEGQSKNGDDQPKKKKKKKDRDTSRSDEIEDNIDSHGKVLAF